MNEKCRELDAYPLAAGGIDNHVHMLVRFPATIAVATLVKELKGASSHLVTHVIAPGEFFKWQGGYGAFTIAKSDVGRVTDYIRNQKQHHAEGRVWDDWERTETPEPDWPE
jgi:REP element-mobilizing transposase RayT